MLSAKPGRCTFTATVSPVFSLPLYTCPREAAAMGFDVNSV